MTRCRDSPCAIVSTGAGAPRSRLLLCILIGVLAASCGCLVPQSPLWVTYLKEEKIAVGGHVSVRQEGEVTITLRQVDTMSKKCLLAMRRGQDAERSSWVSIGEAVLNTKEGHVVVFLKEVDTASVTVGIYSFGRP